MAGRTQGILVWIRCRGESGVESPARACKINPSPSNKVSREWPDAKQGPADEQDGSDPACGRGAGVSRLGGSDPPLRPHPFRAATRRQARAAGRGRDRRYLEFRPTRQEVRRFPDSGDTSAMAKKATNG